jgi:predicted alpha/beta-hydrolase family hydrolase
MYPSSGNLSNPSRTLIFTHGAGGTLSAPAVVNFCTGFATALPVLAFQGSMNLGSRVKGFHACIEYLKEQSKKESGSLVLGGRSMGARAAVMAASEILETRPEDGKIDIILVSYPLKGPKDTRDQILLDLPASVNVLFIIGDRDSMCPLDLLGQVQSKMRAKSQLAIVRGADHGMHTRPAKLEKEMGEETGRIAADWVAGRSRDEVVYIGEEA